MLFPLPSVAEGDLNVELDGGESVRTSEFLSPWDGSGIAIIRVTADVTRATSGTTIQNALRFDKPGTYRLIVPSGVTISALGATLGTGSAILVEAGNTVAIENEGTITGGGGLAEWIRNFGTVTFSGGGDFIGGSFGV